MRNASVLLAAGALMLAASASAAPTRTLVGSVGPGLTIRLVQARGGAVKRVRSGMYTIVVHDRSRVDNFQLVGGSITDIKKTGLRFVGTVRWHLQLGSGRYRYFSGAHPQTMQGRFRVV